LACLLGYFLVIQSYNKFDTKKETIGFCVFKKATSIPCPSCGSTRGVNLLIKGHFIDAIWLNPFSIIIASFLIVVPFWLMYDLIAKKKSLALNYIKVEKQLRKKQILWVVFALIILNWVWNIYKRV
jgi:hypothetical protein